MKRTTLVLTILTTVLSAGCDQAEREKLAEERDRAAQTVEEWGEVAAAKADEWKETAANAVAPIFDGRTVWKNGEKSANERKREEAGDNE